MAEELERTKKLNGELEMKHSDVQINNETLSGENTKLKGVLGQTV